MFAMDDIESCTTTKNDQLVKLSCDTIETLYQKYDNDLYMTSKIHHYIVQQLPVIIDNIQQTRIKNISRMQ